MARWRLPRRLSGRLSGRRRAWLVRPVVRPGGPSATARERGSRRCCCICNDIGAMIPPDMEQTTESGLVVVDRRRSFPRDVPPNNNPPYGSVGPNVEPGFGDTHAMYPAAFPPMSAQAWQGWPVEWATPVIGSFLGFDVFSMRVSAVWACIDLNASIVASFPVYTTRGNLTTASPAWSFNPEPEVYTSWNEFMKQAFTSYMLGEVFILCTGRFRTGDYGPSADHPRGFPARFVMIHPAWVNVEFVDGRRRYAIGGEDVTDDMLHIRYASWPGDARGHGPLEAAAGNLFGAAALERYAAQLASRGGTPWAVLTHPGNLTNNQAHELQSGFVDARSSALGVPAVLSGGITLQQLTLSPKDMALLELRGFDEARLAVLLGVPPFLVGLPSGADSLTYSTTEQLYDFHWRSSLRPKTAAIAAALSEWARPNNERVEFNRDEYTRPAFNERTTGYATMFNIVDPVTGRRAMELDEIRALERLSGGTKAAASLSVTT